jgi:hypothetical protein
MICMLDGTLMYRMKKWSGLNPAATATASSPVMNSRAC